MSDAEGKRISKNQFNLFWAKIDGLFKYNPKPLTSEISDQDLVSFSIGRDSTIYFGEGKFDKGEKNIESQIRSSILDKSMNLKRHFGSVLPQRHHNMPYFHRNHE